MLNRNDKRSFMITTHYGNFVILFFSVANQ